MSEQSVPIEGEPADSRGTATRPVSHGKPLGLAAAALAVFTACVYLYGGFGEDYAAGLSGRIGEVVVQRAIALEKSGQLPEAMAAYRKGLAVPFDDPQQRAWALRRLADLLLRTKRHEEAIPVLGDAIKASPDDLVPYGLLATAYRRSGKHQEELDTAVAWLGLLEKVLPDDNVTRANALFHIADAHEALGRAEEALKVYLEGVEAVPDGPNAYHAATILYKRGEYNRALELIDGYLGSATGWRRNMSLHIKKEITTKISGAAQDPGD